MTDQQALPGTLVSTGWLEAHLTDPDLRVVDVRGYVRATDLGGGHQSALYTGARDEYDAGHIPGSVYIDWTSDIADLDDPVPAQIAPPDKFRAELESRGIGSDSRIVIVDQSGGHFAARFWWALTYYGHDQAALLDGGFNKWVAEGKPVTAEVTEPERAVFTPQTRPHLRVRIEQVAEMIHSRDHLLVDARDATTYTGAVWRGSRKGHIPGAVNLPAKSLYNADGTWKSDAELGELIAAAGITPDTPVVAYCNGGVTATSVLFALDRIGHPNAANYDGSWNEWGERHDLPAETGTGGK